MNKKNNLKQTQYKSFKWLNIVIYSLILLLIISTLYLIPSNALINASEKSASVNTNLQTAQKVAAIRNTKNTDISKRTGKVFYVSATGNDNNDGLSPDTAWKTIDKINRAFDNKTIKKTDTILLNRGDTFRGTIYIKDHEILIGSYGNESLPKPEIVVSPYNGAIEGEWTEVQDNIWKYTINGTNPFTRDVGVIWFHSNGEGLSNKMQNINGTFEYGQKITTNENFDESTLNIKSLLDSDLEFYHAGHPYIRNSRGKELYVYSEENPKNRFDRIEFAIDDHGINVTYFNNIIVDNVAIKYAGAHGISAGTVANLKVTNSEFGYIGGAVQSFSATTHDPIRFGNAVEIYGAVSPQNGYNVEEGFVVRNNYIYQVYDAGLTFQYTADTVSVIENAIFDNNVVEYCNYSVEYWNLTSSTNIKDLENTYINNYEITNNIMRYSGMGVSQTRPDKNQSAHIKTWVNDGTYYNQVKGKYIISNNIFDTSSEQVFWIHAGEEKSLPQVTNNTFYNSYNVKLGYYYANTSKYEIPFVQNKLEQVFPNNKFNYLENDLDSYTGSGTSGEVNWSYNNDTGVLHITGTGKMKDYSREQLPEWYNARSFIKKIIIDENITHIGQYAFYDLPYVEELEINCKQLDNFSNSDINIGSNYSFYQTGRGWFGMDVTIGENVTIIPSFMFWPAEHEYEAPLVKNLTFKGNKIKTIKDHAFLQLKDPVIIIPEGVEKIESLAFANTSGTVAISVPNTVTIINPWAFAGNTSLEKIVFGKNVQKIHEHMLSASRKLKEAIFTSDIEYGSSNYNGLFSHESTNTIIYGNDSIKELISNYSSNTNTSNIKYKNNNEYKININSNTNLIEFPNEYQAAKEITITAKEGYKIDNIEVYQIYKANNNKVYTIGKMNISSTNNTYIIPGLYWDIDIKANVSKIEDNKEDNKPDNEDDKPTDNKPEDDQPNEDDKPNKDDNVDTDKDNEPNKDDNADVNKDDQTNQEEPTVNTKANLSIIILIFVGVSLIMLLCFIFYKTKDE